MKYLLAFLILLCLTSCGAMIEIEPAPVYVRHYYVPHHYGYYHHGRPLIIYKHQPPRHYHRR